MEPYDEARDGARRPRPHYAEVLDALADAGPGALAEAASARARAAGIAVGTSPLPVDPVPRVVPAAEWASVAVGLTQRARALDVLVEASYGGAPHALPPEILDSTPYLERDLVGIPAGGPAIGIVGFDLVRGPDGVLRVLEDNVLTPGHVALPAARELLRLWERVATRPVPVHEPLRDALLAMLGDPAEAAILGDAPPSWELARLARFLGVPTVAPSDLVGSPAGVRCRRTGRPFAVLWQRTGEDRLRDDDGALTELGALLLAPLRTGAVRVVNRVGAGIVHDKRAIPHVGAVIRDVLGEAPAIETVPTLDLACAVARAGVLADLPGHVVKPAVGAGGRGVRFGDAGDARELRALLESDGRRLVAQPKVPLSVHPTVDGDRLVGRPVDLRAFAIHAGDGWVVIPGGVSRYPTRDGERVVNTSAGGGIKDVWVLP